MRKEMKQRVENEDVRKALGLDERVKTVDLGDCVFCGQQIDLHSFRDLKAIRKFRIDGPCQECQDEMANEGK